MIALAACGPDATPVARPEMPAAETLNPNSPIPETGLTTGRRTEVIDQPGYVEPAGRDSSGMNAAPAGSAPSAVEPATH